MNAAPATEATTDVAPCCVLGEAVDDALAQDLARVFKALGDPTRVKLMSLIAHSSEGEMCVCDLTAPVGLSQPTVSHHMKLLVEARLVEREQRGRWAYYRPTVGTLASAAKALIA
ncbi:metalloregulator ArsR/SmtB family transcription factor [Microbacterium sp. ARD32]|uniref:ArsR/SmtB family transcription factor n=1 Tax=Microbacterium sp. ARD32 TaxID=2962577 RepID=UPI0028823B5C|nr:metalloregulator ArsR/SmtB family transcription factor [Microbacterium sp. ARD32]MDT0157272.1 metalloregulator ArsR/SmtB family transcription factor [Microbacterium sp. ARD32]